MAAWLNRPHGPDWVAPPTATTGLASPRQRWAPGKHPGRSPRPGHPWWHGCHALTGGAPPTRYSPTAPWLCGRQPGMARGSGTHRRGVAMWRQRGAAVRWDFAAAVDVRRAVAAFWWFYSCVDRRRLRGEDLIKEQIGRGPLTPKGGDNGGVLAWTAVRRWAAGLETCTASSG
jgi:hypothetical protein